MAPVKLSFLITVMLIFCFFSLCEAKTDVQLGGHIKASASVSRRHDESVLQSVGTGDDYDGAGELRLKGQCFFGDRLYLETHYETMLTGGDTRSRISEIARRMPHLSSIISGTTVDDRRRLLDLTKNIDETDDYILYHRMDRWYLKYISEWGSMSIGRQALTWGNGRLFNPMDLFNPFAPTDIQRDYKIGDDMAVVQFFCDKIGDFQFLYVPRRDLKTGEIKGSHSSLAGRCHILKDSFEFDIMAAKHYAAYVFGLGTMGYIKDAAWRMNIVYTSMAPDARKKEFLTFVANLDYSWVWLKKNVYGFLEWYYNSLGDDDYDQALSNPDITERLERGELFTLGRNYLAGEIQVELHPLFNLFMTVVTNTHDPSFIAQPRMVWDAFENIQLIVGAGIYTGKTGSEFGGFKIPGTDFIQKPADTVFAWLTYYF